MVTLSTTDPLAARLVGLINLELGGSLHWTLIYEHPDQKSSAVLVPVEVSKEAIIEVLENTIEILER